MIEAFVQQVSSRWWTFLVRGLIALVIAVYIFMQPAAAETGLVYLVAAYFIIHGFMAFVGGFSSVGFGEWPILVLTGIVQVALGIVMIAQPGIGPLALAYLVAIWAIMTGVSEIATGIALRKVMDNDAWWIILGVLTLALGAYIIVRPDLGVAALVYTVGIYTVLAAIALFVLAFRFRALGSSGTTVNAS